MLSGEYLFKENIIGDDLTRKPLVIPGFHAVKETLRGSDMQVREIWIESGKKGPRVDDVLRLAKARGVPAVFKNREDIERLAPGTSHQGILALAGMFSYVELKDLLRRPLNAGDFRFIVAADHITDEGNLGSLIRTAAFFGVQGLILPKDRSAQVTGKLLKRTSGAYFHLSVARVVNLVKTLDLLREAGFWIIGAAGEGTESVYDFDWNRDAVLILGSESKGLSRLVRERCDAIVRIPGTGKVESLNVSVAGGVILAEVMRQRSKGKP